MKGGGSECGAQGQGDEGGRPPKGAGRTGKGPLARQTDRPTERGLSHAERTPVYTRSAKSVLRFTPPARRLVVFYGGNGERGATVQVARDVDTGAAGGTDSVVPRIHPFHPLTCPSYLGGHHP